MPFDFLLPHMFLAAASYNHDLGSPRPESRDDYGERAMPLGLFRSSVPRLRTAEGFLHFQSPKVTLQSLHHSGHLLVEIFPSDLAISRLGRTEDRVREPGSYCVVHAALSSHARRRRGKYIIIRTSSLSNWSLC